MSASDYHTMVTAVPTSPSTATVVTLAAPLLLAIAGSALTPLPCAFDQAGVLLGTLTCLVIAVANDYTSCIMVRAAARLGVSGYEEVILQAGGRRAHNFCRLALVVLLFGTMCGCLAAIQETSTHAVGEFAARTGSGAAEWLAFTEVGRASLLVCLTVTVLLPLSLASLGELPFVPLLGVVMMVGITSYVMYSAISTSSHHASIVAISTPQSWLGVTEAASTFGYAFYVQPYAVPLLVQAPAGDQNAQALTRALHLTFVLTALSYLCVGLGGLIFFGEGHVPQDLLQGFSGRLGGVLSAVFSLYLMLCFFPTVVPLRETLVRLYHEASLSYFVLNATPRLLREDVLIAPDGAEVRCNTRPCLFHPTCSLRLGA